MRYGVTGPPAPAGLLKEAAARCCSPAWGQSQFYASTISKTSQRERGAAMEGPDFSSVHERDHPTFAEQLFGGIFEGFEVLT